MIGHTLVGFVDNAMVGQLGTSELAAISLGNSFVFLAMAFGIGFSTAITPLIAESDAKKNKSNTLQFHPNPLPARALRDRTATARRPFLPKSHRKTKGF